MWFFRGSFSLYPLYEKLINTIYEKEDERKPLTDFEQYVKEKREDNLIEFDNKKISIFASTIFPCFAPSKTQARKFDRFKFSKMFFKFNRINFLTLSVPI